MAREAIDWLDDEPPPPDPAETVPFDERDCAVLLMANHLRAIADGRGPLMQATMLVTHLRAVLRKPGLPGPTPDQVDALLRGLAIAKASTAGHLVPDLDATQNRALFDVLATAAVLWGDEPEVRKARGPNALPNLLRSLEASRTILLDRLGAAQRRAAVVASIIDQARRTA